MAAKPKSLYYWYARRECAMNEHKCLERSRIAARGSCLCAAMLLAFLLLAPHASTQEGPAISYKGTVETDALHAGASVRVAFTFQLGEGWHVNSNKPLDEFAIATALGIEPASGIAATAMAYPEHTVLKLSFSPEPVAVFGEEFTIGVALGVAEDMAPGDYTLTGKLHYQACNDTACWRPLDLEVALPVTVVAPSVPLSARASELFAAIPWDDAIAVEADTAEAEGEEIEAPEPEPSPAQEDWRALADRFEITGRLSGYNEELRS